MRAVGVAVIVVIAMMTVMRIGILVVAFFAMENQEIHAERIKSCDKHAGQHGKVGEACSSQVTFVHGFNDAVFGVET